MTAPAGYIPDILEEHLEELQFLLARRPMLRRAPAAHWRDLVDLDERIQAHLDGVLAAGEPAVAPAAALVRGEDPAAIRAAVFALAHLPVPSAADALATAFAAATGESLVAMAEAMRLGPAAGVVRLAESRLHDAAPLARVLSAGLIARHRGARPNASWLTELLRDANPLVRRHTWRLAGESGVTLDAKTYALAVRDEDPIAKREGMLAAARCGVPGILALVRKAAESPAPAHADALRLLAALGTRADEKRLRYVVTDTSLGSLRFELAGLHGSPAYVELLIDAMGDEDPRTALAAGAAFMRMTGADVESAERVTLPPDDGSTPDEFESEFLDEGRLPDTPKARAHWSRTAATFAEAERICAGRNVSTLLDEAAFQAIDLDSAWWQAIRHRFHGWSVPGAFTTASLVVPSVA